MVMSIRKISYELPELTGAGILWFPDLNEMDPYCILPVTAALLNYFNLTVSAHFQNFLLIHTIIKYLTLFC